MGAPMRNTANKYGAHKTRFDGRLCPRCGLSNRLPHLVPYDCELASLLWEEQQAKADAKRRTR